MVGMRIAQIAPPWVRVPPQGYGGVERIVSQLTEELVKRGHDVTLFASGDSQTHARLSSYFPLSIGNDGNKKKNLYSMLFHLYPAFRDSHTFDVIHCHDIYQSMFFADLVATPVVHTIHGTLMKHEQPEDRREVYEQFSHQSFVSISNAQRAGLPHLHYIDTVYNGIDMSEFSFGKGDGGYVAWMGRITPKKGIVEAIEAAKQVGIPLRIAAVVDPVDQEFFDRFVAPSIDGTEVQFVGELKEKERESFFQHAKALLNPIRWHEPFGLVMVEAMACGTPVIATRMGSTPEIVEDGSTGFLGEGTPLAHDMEVSAFSIDPVSVSFLTQALQKIVSLDQSAYSAMRERNRKRVERLFTVASMVDGYEKVYENMKAVHHEAS